MFGKKVRCQSTEMLIRFKPTNKTSPEDISINELNLSKYFFETVQQDCLKQIENIISAKCVQVVSQRLATLLATTIAHTPIAAIPWQFFAKMEAIFLTFPVSTIMISMA